MEKKMSDRLVSADKAKEVLKHLLYETAMDNDIDIADIYEDIIENRLDTWIELIPTVDAVPVVRCQDCEYYNGEYKYCVNDIFAKPNGYCSYGKKNERKNGQ
jgi:hypothetical protein